MLTRWNDWGFGDLDRTLAEFDALRREMNRLFDARAPLSYARYCRAATRGWVLFDRGSRARRPCGAAGRGRQGRRGDRGSGDADAARRSARSTCPEGYSVHRQERTSLKFARSLTLPGRVDSEKTTANLKHGVLTLVLPKTPEDQPRQIAVSTK